MNKGNTVSFCLMTHFDLRSETPILDTFSYYADCGTRARLTSILLLWAPERSRKNVTILIDVSAVSTQNSSCIKMLVRFKKVSLQLSRISSNVPQHRMDEMPVIGSLLLRNDFLVRHGANFWKFLEGYICERLLWTPNQRFWREIIAFSSLFFLIFFFNQKWI